MDERGRAIFEGEDDAMEAPDQQRMTPQISENATVEQVDLHFVGLVDTEEEEPLTRRCFTNLVKVWMFMHLESMMSRKYFHRHVSRKEPTVLD